MSIAASASFGDDKATALINSSHDPAYALGLLQQQLICWLVHKQLMASSDLLLCLPCSGDSCRVTWEFDA
jgi:hypothetical protein